MRCQNLRACGGGRSIAFKWLLRRQRTVRRMTLLLLLGGWLRWAELGELDTLIE